MKRFLGLLAAFCFSVAGFSQIEGPNRSFKISPKKLPEKPATPTVLPATPAVIKYESSLDKKDEKLLKGFSLLPKKEEKGIMEPDITIRDPAELYTEKFNKELRKEGIGSELEKRDYFLGEFMIFTTTLYIACRDHQAPDGDMVRIWLNGEIVKPQITLETGFVKYTLTLNEGMNLIEIEALNTGELFPNTGQFLFQDADEQAITLQTWNLHEGNKAFVRLIRIDKLKKQE